MKLATKYLFVALLLLLSVSSCNRGKIILQRHSAFAEDSTMIDISCPAERVIHVGSQINPRPLASQIVQIEGKEKYLIADLDYIYVFDWETGILEDSISTKACGPLRNYSGFNYVDAENILVYAQSEIALFVIDSRGNKKEHFKLPESNKGSDWLCQPIGLNYSRPHLLNDSIVLLSGSMLGPLNESPEKPIVMTEVNNSKDGDWHVTCYYPDAYYMYNWGSNYMYAVSTAKDKKGCVVYSLPIMEEVLKYKDNFSTCDTLFMRSRYDEGIKSCNISMTLLNMMPSKETKYYIEQTSYGEIFYDEYRDVYLRIAKHPLRNWEDGKPFPKPFSIIMADCDGNIISESSIIQPDGLYTWNMHICKDGIAIAQLNSDEDNIYFNVYPINK